MPKDRLKNGSSFEAEKLKNVLRDFLSEANLFQKSIQHLRKKIESSSGEYGTSCSHIEWTERQTGRYEDLGNPTPSFIFYIRSVIEALSLGSMSEKELKAAVFESCKELGVKVTGRGAVAGANIDISIICGILNGIGVLEPDLGPTSIIYTRDNLAGCRRAFMTGSDSCIDMADTNTTAYDAMKDINGRGLDSVLSLNQGNTIDVLLDSSPHQATDISIAGGIEEAVESSNKLEASSMADSKAEIEDTIVSVHEESEHQKLRETGVCELHGLGLNETRLVSIEDLVLPSSIGTSDVILDQSSEIEPSAHSLPKLETAQEMVVKGEDDFGSHTGEGVITSRRKPLFEAEGDVLPAGLGRSLFLSISVRWAESLDAYINDARRSYQAALAAAAVVTDEAREGDEITSEFAQKVHPNDSSSSSERSGTNSTIGGDAPGDATFGVKKKRSISEMCADDSTRDASEHAAMDFTAQEHKVSSIELMDSNAVGHSSRADVDGACFASATLLEMEASSSVEVKLEPVSNGSSTADDLRCTEVVNDGLVSSAESCAADTAIDNASTQTSPVLTTDFVEQEEEKEEKSVVNKTSTTTYSSPGVMVKPQFSDSPFLSMLYSITTAATSSSSSPSSSAMVGGKDRRTTSPSHILPSSMDAPANNLSPTLKDSLQSSAKSSPQTDSSMVQGRSNMDSVDIVAASTHDDSLKSPQCPISLELKTPATGANSDNLSSADSLVSSRSVLSQQNTLKTVDKAQKPAALTLKPFRSVNCTGSSNSSNMNSSILLTSSSISSASSSNNSTSVAKDLVSEVEITAGVNVPLSGAVTIEATTDTSMASPVASPESPLVSSSGSPQDVIGGISSSEEVVMGMSGVESSIMDGAVNAAPTSLLADPTQASSTAPPDAEESSCTFGLSATISGTGDEPVPAKVRAKPWSRRSAQLVLEASSSGTSTLAARADAAVSKDGLVAGSDAAGWAIPAGRIGGEASGTSQRSGKLKSTAGALSKMLGSRGSDSDNRTRVTKRAINQRAWRLVEGMDLSVFLDPSSALEKWAKACYEEAVALEIEEGILRRLAGQCKLSVPSAAVRVGTVYLSQERGDERRNPKKRHVPSFRNGGQYTAAMLWEKAHRKKIKNCHGSGGGSGNFSQKDIPPVYNSAYHALGGGADAGSGGGESSMGMVSVKSGRKSGSAGSLSNSHSTSAAGSHYFPICVRHFVPPLELKNPEATAQLYSSGALPVMDHLAPIHLPDLSISTCFVPWRTLAREFMPLEDESEQLSPRTSSGSSMMWLPPASVDASDSAGNSSSSSSSSGNRRQAGAASGLAGDVIDTSGADGTHNRKKMRVTVDSAAGGAGAALASRESSGASHSGRGRRGDSSGGSSPRTRSSSFSVHSLWGQVVLAPQVREIEPITADGASDEESGEEEDISDEAVLARHEATLKKMRDRWALLQQLRQEQKDLLSGGASTGGGGSSAGGNGGATPRGSHKAAPAASAAAGSESERTSSPRGAGMSKKNGVARRGGYARRRGRPPKPNKYFVPSDRREMNGQELDVMEDNEEEDETGDVGGRLDSVTPIETGLSRGSQARVGFNDSFESADGDDLDIDLLSKDDGDETESFSKSPVGLSGDTVLASGKDGESGQRWEE